MGEDRGADLDLIVTQDGSHSIYSPSFADSYHSRHGAIQESQLVYIEAGLVHQLEKTRQVNILELGFGTGLNVALSFIKSMSLSDCFIRYTSLEAYPLPEKIVDQINYSEKLQLPGFNIIHYLSWDKLHELSNSFVLEKRSQEFETLNDVNVYDLVYYDAFSPGSQPHLWQEAMVKRVIKAMRSDASLVSYCSKGSFRRTLQQQGLLVEKLNGPPGKREIIRATKVR